MDLHLVDKQALVTGGSRGIGRAIAKLLREEGSAVTVCGRDRERLRETAQDLAVDTVVADVTQGAGLDALRKAVDELPASLDILVCNVGSGRVPDSERDPWQRMLDVNFLSAARTIDALTPKMSQGGAIVCVSSIAGRAAIGAPAAYAASKSALESMIANLCRPLARAQIRITGVAPGNVMFKGSVWETKISEDPEGVSAMLGRDVPMGRFATAEEIASLVVFLASPAASFITGSIHVADGGQIAGR